MKNIIVASFVFLFLFIAGYYVVRLGFRGDLAERMPLSPYASEGSLYPSSAEIVAVDADGFIQKCMNRESPYVVGIVSTKPAHTLRNMMPGSVPVALSGVVPCKIVSENGYVQAGDLLVASSKPGYAMKAPRETLPGSIVGKAMDRQEQDEDIITVLVMIR